MIPARSGSLLRCLLIFLACALLPALARADASLDQLRSLSEATPRLDLQLGATGNADAGSVSGKSQLHHDASGRLQVLVYTSRNLGAAELATLVHLGLFIAHSNTTSGMIEGWLAPSQLTAVSSQPFVHFVTLPRHGKTHIGSVTSEGVHILSADALQSLGVNGAGVRVGVISDGVTGLATSQSTGDLGAVTVVSDPCTPSAPGDCAEGTAMLEIVHDMAPQASLGFCGVSTLLSMESCVTALANTFGANIIVDDISFDDESIFEDSALATSIDTLDNAGLLYVSAAGNSHGCHYDADYLPTATGSGVYDSFHDFGVTAGTTTSRNNHVFIPSGGVLEASLQWNDPFSSSSNDYDLFLLSASGRVLASSTNVQNGSGAPPLEIISYQNAGLANVTANLVIARHAGAAAKHVHVQFSDGSSGCNGVTPIEYTTLRSEVTGHAGATGAIAAAAIDANNSQDPQHLLIEPYSSWGPQRYDFPSLQLRSKPDISGVDDVSISGAGGFVFPGGCSGPSCFSGTSAAAPHIAGVLALLKGSFSGNYRQALLDSATNTGGSAFTYGTGRANALAAAEALNLPPVPDIVLPAANGAYDISKPFTLSGSCSDPEKMATTLAWSIPALGYSSSRGTATGIRFGTPGSYSATLSCTDALGAVSHASVNFTVAVAPLRGAGVLVAPAAGKHDYSYVDIDASGLSQGGTITIQIALGHGSSMGSCDLFPLSYTPPASGVPAGSLSHAYNMAPGSQTTLSYTVAAGAQGKFKLGLEGGSGSKPGATNNYTYQITVTP